MGVLEWLGYQRYSLKIIGGIIVTISSLNRYESLYNIQSNYSNTKNADSSQVGQTLEDLGQTIKLANGDTFELTSSTLDGTTNTYDSNSSSFLQDFLKKVKNGTVTASDLSNMQNKLGSMSQQLIAMSMQQSVASTTDTSGINDFLNKVQSGTVTNTDLKDMQTKLLQMQQASNTNETTSLGDISDLKSFMEKVKDGTVTDSDLKDMQDKLNQMQQTSSNKPKYHGMAKGNDALEIKNFLDNVRNGTTTDSDLKDMQAKLTDLENHFNSKQNSSSTDEEAQVTTAAT
jgi:soluble cytochrome b562